MRRTIENLQEAFQKWEQSSEQTFNHKKLVGQNLLLIKRLGEEAKVYGTGEMARQLGVLMFLDHLVGAAYKLSRPQYG